MCCLNVETSSFRMQPKGVLIRDVPPDTHTHTHTHTRTRTRTHTHTHAHTHAHAHAHTHTHTHTHTHAHAHTHTHTELQVYRGGNPGISPTSLLISASQITISWTLFSLKKEKAVLDIYICLVFFAMYTGLNITMKCSSLYKEC